MRYIIFSNNIYTLIKISPAFLLSATLEALPGLSLSLDPQSDSSRTTILSLPTQIDAEFLPCHVTDAIHMLWVDPAVKEGVRRSPEFQLNHNNSATYYFDAIDRIGAPDYLPTDQDILKSWVETIEETTFKVREETYKFINVASLRSDKRKWMHYFQDVTALVFLNNMSDYDQTYLRGHESVVCSSSFGLQSVTPFL